MANKVNEFLKEMTELTGKYGDELFDFIREKIDPKQKLNQQNGGSSNNSSTAEASEKLGAIKKGAPNT